LTTKSVGKRRTNQDRIAFDVSARTIGRQEERTKREKMKSYNQTCRRGVAPLEFVMAFPLFAIFLTLIIYVTGASVTQLNFSNALRNDAWNKRNNAEIENSRTQTAPLDFFQGKQGSLSAQNVATIKNGNYFDFWKHKASSNHLLFNGTWSTASSKEGSACSPLYERLRNDSLLSDVVDSDSLSKLPLSFPSKDLNNTVRP